MCSARQCQVRITGVVDCVNADWHCRAVMPEPKQLTVRNPPAELSRRLRALADSRGESVNTTIIRLLQDALGIDERRERLARYASWSEADAREFDDALALQRTVDEELWK